MRTGNKRNETAEQPKSNTKFTHLDLQIGLLTRLGCVEVMKMNLPHHKVYIHESERAGRGEALGFPYTMPHLEQHG
jgi:hypothetical protein